MTLLCRTSYTLGTCQAFLVYLFLLFTSFLLSIFYLFTSFLIFFFENRRGPFRVWKLCEVTKPSFKLSMLFYVIVTVCSDEWLFVLLEKP